MTGNLLQQAADWFKARETAIGAWYNDDRGRYAFRVTVDGQAFIVTAKKYLKAGDASFMRKKVVQRAIDTDALLVLFVAEGGYQYVFDPAAVMDYGEPPGDDSQRAKQGEDWLDVSARFGVPFEDWFDDRQDPPRHPTWSTSSTSTSTDGGQQGLDAFQGPGDTDG